MKRPDQTFTIAVCETYRVHGCATKRADEAKGFYGFHQYATCPDCQVVSEGWQFWGENGHLQGSAATRELMVHFVGYKARQQWRMKAGGIMGYRFVVGAPQYYVGCPAEELAEVTS